MTTADDAKKMVETERMIMLYAGAETEGFDPKPETLQGYLAHKKESSS